MTSCILRVASIHFRTTLARCNQPHTIALHLSFLRRSAVGRATFIVSAAKIGRTVSVVQISVAQDQDQDQNQAQGRDRGRGRVGSGSATAATAAAPRPFVVGYLTQANLASESGVSLPTDFRLDPAPLARGSTADLRANADPNWVLQPQPSFGEWRNALRRVETYVPRRGGSKVHRGGGGAAADRGNDEWIRLASGERWTQESLGFVCDTFPLIPDAYGLQEDAEQLKKISEEEEDKLRLHHYDDDDDDDQRRKTKRRRIQSASSPSPSSSSSSSPPPPPPSAPKPDRDLDLTKFWFPTLVLNIEFKKLLPPEGVEWLFVRVRPKQIRNGRMDLEVMVLDEQNEIVALSWHVALIVGGERNLRGRL